MSTLHHDFDITKQRPGARLGGNFGHVITCPKCKRSCCKINERTAKGQPIDRYAHMARVLSTPLSSSSEWLDICEVPRKGPLT